MTIRDIDVATAVVAAVAGLPAPVHCSHLRRVLRGRESSNFEGKPGVIGGRRYYLEFAEQCESDTDALNMQIEDAYDAYDAATSQTEGCTSDEMTSTCTNIYSTPDSAAQALIDACNGVTGLEVLSYGQIDIKCTASNGTFTAAVTYSYDRFADCYAESCNFDQDSFIAESEKEFEAAWNEGTGFDNANCTIDAERIATFTDQCLNDTHALDEQIESAYDAYEDATTEEESCSDDKTDCAYTFTTPESARESLTGACEGVGLEVFSYRDMEIICTGSNETYAFAIAFAYNEFTDCYAETCNFDQGSFIAAWEKDFEESLNFDYGIGNTNCSIDADYIPATPDPVTPSPTSTPDTAQPTTPSPTTSPDTPQNTPAPSTSGALGSTASSGAYYLSVFFAVIFSG